MSTIALTEQNYDDTIKNNQDVIVKYSAPWCPPCRMYTPVFDRESGEHDGILFATVNIDENEKLSEQLNIQSIPTTIMYHDGAPVNRYTGAMTQTDLNRAITANYARN